MAAAGLASPDFLQFCEPLGSGCFPLTVEVSFMILAPNRSQEIEDEQFTLATVNYLGLVSSLL